MSIASPSTPAIVARSNPRRPSFWSGLRASASLARREQTRFFRQPTRVIGALGQPVILWALLAAGFQSSFRPAGGPQTDSAGQFFFPGIVIMIVLFTAIFATISIIEDRREGFLQGVLVSPMPRWSVVLGKVMGGTSLACIQAGLFLLLAGTAGLDIERSMIPGILGLLILVAFALTSVGVIMAWRMESTQGFHALMSVLLMPMWVLSGAFFPRHGAPGWLGWIMALNPLTYGTSALRQLMAVPGSKGIADGPSLWINLLVTLLFAAISFTVACRLAERPTRGTS